MAEREGASREWQAETTESAKAVIALKTATDGACNGSTLCCRNAQERTWGQDNEKEE